MIRSFAEIDSRTLARYRSDPAAFIEECLISPYDGELYQLNPAERQFIHHMFQLDDDGRMLYPMLLYSAIKKSRKTELAGMLTLTLILLHGGRFAEAYILANDQQQSIDRCFTACKRIVEASPLIKREANCLQDKIVFPTAQMSITAVPSNYSSLAGGHPTISVFDEAWGFVSERSRRLFDECVPTPTRKISCRLIVSHAGWSGESQLLEELYHRGLQLPEIGPDLRAGDGCLMYWSHHPICHWQDERWLSEMRRSLRPNQFRRMICNEFVQAEANFVSMDWYDGCVDPSLSHRLADHSLPAWAAVDASIKHDSTALALVGWDQEHQKVPLFDHKIVLPSPEQPIDFSTVVEQTILDWHGRFNLQCCLYDPYQMAASAQVLSRAGVVMQEYPQTLPNLTQMAENLHNLIKGRNFVAYPDAEIRTAIARSVAVEGARGWKISKEKQSHKIDIVVAIGMAALAAIKAQGEAYDYTMAWVSAPDDETNQPDSSRAWHTQQLYQALNNNVLMHTYGRRRW